MKTAIKFFILFICQLAYAVSLQQTLKEAGIPEYQYQIINTYPHDPENFTEGLFFQDGVLYESTGLNGKSRLIKTDMQTGKIIREKSLPIYNFGEGLTGLNDELYQLTWKEHTGFVYDKNSLGLKRKFSFTGEGWGLTNDGKQLMMSNGSSTLVFLDPQSLKPVRSLVVSVGAKKIFRLNELEYIDGMIFANVWKSAIILVISPQTGNVQGWFNLAELVKLNMTCSECVANGIAYNPQDKVIYVTGKNWLNLYAIKLQ